MVSDIPFRETYGLMPHGTDVVMYVVLLPFAALFLYGVYIRLSIYGSELVKELVTGFPRGIKFLFSYAFLQRKIVKEPRAGIMHVLIYFGILTLLIGTLLVALDYDITQRFFGFAILKGEFYLVYELVLDIMGIALLIGLAMLVYRRFLGADRRLRPKLEYGLILSGLLFMTVTGYLLEGLRLYLNPRAWGQWSVVGYAVANALAGLAPPAEAALLTYQALWWSHALVAFTMVALLPYTQLAHIAISALNVYVGGWMHEQLASKAR